MRYCLRTVTWRFHKTHEPLPELKGRAFVCLQSPEDLYNTYRSLFTNQVRERFVVFWLDSSNKVLGLEIISEGTLNSSPVHAREVFRGAIVSTASSIVVAHNHPSNSLEASTEDIAITKKLVDSGELLGIPVEDHIIFCNQGYFSFREHNLM